jgi:hypothetical protein
MCGRTAICVAIPRTCKSGSPSSIHPRLTHASSGCGVDGDLDTYGSDFNAGGGGVYATLYSSQGITIWFFPRKKIPKDLQKGHTVDPSKWPAPVVRFRSGSNCETGNYFKNQTIVGWPHLVQAWRALT